VVHHPPYLPHHIGFAFEAPEPMMQTAQLSFSRDLGFDQMTNLHSVEGCSSVCWKPPEKTHSNGGKHFHE